jgi:hypothetical protein
VFTNQDLPTGLLLIFSSFWYKNLSSSQYFHRLLRRFIAPLLETTMQVAGKRGIVGTELFERFTADLAFPEGALYLKAAR